MMRAVAFRLFLLIFIALSVGGFLFTSIAAQPSCPFMPGEHTVCLMTALDHFNAWQGAFRGTLAGLILQLVVCVVFFLYPRLLDPLVLTSTTERLRIRHTGLPPPLYQKLLRQGLLNPKNP